MHGVNFGDYNSYLDIPGGDGVIDYTEYFGDVHYKNRSLSFDFQTNAPQAEFMQLFSSIQDALHGKKMRVWLDEDVDFYYYGRVTVNEWKSNGRIGKITIDVDAEPWKYKKYETVQTIPVSGTTNFVIQNGRRSTVPNISVSASMTITFEGKSYSLDSGTVYNFPNIVLKQGNNYFAATGTGTATFSYQEGGL